MIEISLCLIVKNEEDVIGRCLESVKDFVDEIVIADTGSTDRTKEIARSYGAKIYDFEWCNDFGKARNFSFSKATKEYILWLDADDVITEESMAKLMKLKSGMKRDVDVVSMEYSLSRNEFGETTYSLRRNRIVKRKKNFKWIGRIHEYLEVGGNIIHSDAAVNHVKDKPHTNRNLNIFKLMKENNDQFTDRDRFYYANELYYNGEYEEAIEEYNKFIDGGRGWVEDLRTATANIIQCYGNLNMEEEKAEAILKSCKWGTPRADICCRFGEYFINKGDYNSAIFWYKAARNSVPTKDYMGIAVKEYYTWIPTIQLCVCYSNIGDYENAYYYNELTALYVPDSVKVEHNRKFLKEQFKGLNLEIPKLTLIKE